MQIKTNIYEILQLIKTKSIKSIAIDGFNGIGKSTLSKSISKSDFNIIEMDNFAFKSTTKPPQYRVKLLKVKNEIMKSDSYILEGICMINKLKAMNIRPDLYIYLLRVSPYKMIREDVFDEDYKFIETGTLADIINNYHIKNNMVKDIREFKLNYAKHISKYQLLIEVID